MGSNRELFINNSKQHVTFVVLYCVIYLLVFTNCKFVYLKVGVRHPSGISVFI